MSEQRDGIQREVLPIPERPPVGLTTYDAKDPDTAFPPIEPLRPPEGAPNVLVVLIDDVGLRRVAAPSAGRATRRTFERLAGGGLEYTRFHTTALCSPTRAALLTGRNHHTVGMGGITEIATSAPGYSSIRPNTLRAAGRDAEAQRLQHRAVRQVPRGAGLGDQPDGPVRPLADRRWRLRALLRLHRRRDQPVRTRRSTRAPRRSSRPDAGGGLPPHRGPGRPRDRLGAPAEGADAGQAVLHVLRARRHARPAPRADGVGRQVRGPVRPGLGRAARGDLRPAEGARRRPAGRRADRAPRRDPRLGRHARGAQAGARPPDGGLRRVPGAHRPPRRPAHRRAGGARRPRRHAGLLHHRRQRRLGRGHRSTARFNEMLTLNGAAALETPEFMARTLDEFGRPDGLQPLRRRLGARHGHAVPVDQAGRLALGRHPQRHDRALAGRHRGPGRDPQPVPPRHRRRPDRARGRRPAGADSSSTASSRCRCRA